VVSADDEDFKVSELSKVVNHLSQLKTTTG
jgi:hypothetical protein